MADESEHLIELASLTAKPTRSHKKKPAPPAPPGSLGALAQRRAQALQTPTAPRAPKGTILRQSDARFTPNEPAASPAPAPPTEDERMKAHEPRWWVRWVNPATHEFKYYGVVYDHGQILPLRDGPTREKLENIMYVAQVESPRLVAKCGVCGAEFMNERFLNTHGAKRHSDRFATADELEVRAGMQTEHGDAAVVDVTGDAAERRLMQEFPLALENTTASRNG